MAKKQLLKPQQNTFNAIFRKKRIKLTTSIVETIDTFQGLKKKTIQNKKSNKKLEKLK